MANFKRTIICIDGLDECHKETRGNLLHALQDILNSPTSHVKIFITSRDDDDIVLCLKGFPNVYIKTSDNRGDIDQFVEAETERCIAEKEILRGSVTPELKELIIATLVKGAHGMYDTKSFCTLYDFEYNRINHNPGFYGLTSRSSVSAGRNLWRLLKKL